MGSGERGYAHCCIVCVMAYRAAVVGGSGYTGAELLRLLAGHPEIEVVVVTADSNVGASVGELFPSLAAAYDLTYAPLDPADLAGLDVVFLALPHGQSQTVARALVDRSVTSSTWAPTSGCRTPTTRPGTARSTPHPTCSTASRSACPSCTAPRSVPPATSPRPAAIRRRPRSPWRRCCTTASSSRAASWSTRSPACPARGAG